MNQQYFENRELFRSWLESNYKTVESIWLVYYKKHTKIRSITYAEAVEEALCFGWIDSKIKRIDEERYMQLFTPRNPKSTWSKVNKERCLKLIDEGKMTSAGIKLIEEAKKSGWWEKAYSSKERKNVKIPAELEKGLRSESFAWENFKQFTANQQSQYIRWIVSAKREETRLKRIETVVERSAKNIKPGII